MASFPCIEAYRLAASAIGFGSLAFILGIISLGLHIYKFQDHQNKEIIRRTKFDIESSSWIFILSGLASVAASISVIANYNCGPDCPLETLTCNEQMGKYGTAMIASISAASASGLRIWSIWYQTPVPLVVSS